MLKMFDSWFLRKAENSLNFVPYDLIQTGKGILCVWYKCSLNYNPENTCVIA